MRNWWIKFGCFLTGYNYGIVRTSSEVSSKAVKKYTSAMLIVCILWSFVGFMFTQRYLRGNIWGSVAGSALMVVIIVQIERQIILSLARNRWLYISRGILAALMAILGTIIIDQIIFKEDIELEKITFIQKRVDQGLPPKTQELNTQIASIDTAILKKEADRSQLIDEVTKTPYIKTTSTQSSPIKKQTTIKDSSGKIITTEQVVNSTSVSVTTVPNPKFTLIATLDQTISNLRTDKSKKDSALLNIRPELEKQISSKIGFLDELEIMCKLITGSGVAFFVWIIWFLFLMWLEMLVLISKLTDAKSDYEETIKHQMNLQMKKLEALAKLAHQ
ncbi:hypothetical protein A4D02_00215 [Niastella koreensis]|uniref:DUF4407 domain-containing protein n=2 Tax=Niastella koreensis TaxID=354356 RepID=G8TA39_NIAKG|nr:DUF4407 domain-containing protein [Niastella koreensis]AEW02411.1 hypothetical protein Niako_6186 [Niastella koreensis GR20-10]OQP54788.1 hypothetical protein A4D02_00215 [Niastella koreensis]